MKKKIAGRILISLIGAAFIICGLAEIALGVWGQPATATVTSIRRQGGEREDARPGRYTYHIAYSFTVPGGRQIDGSFTKTGNAIFMKPEGTGTIAVSYFRCAPFINVPEENARLSPRQPILIGAGCLLLVTVNRRKKRKTPSAKGAGTR